MTRLDERGHQVSSFHTTMRLDERGHQVSPFHTMKKLDERGHQVSPFHTMKELLMFTLLKHIRASASSMQTASEYKVHHVHTGI